MYFEQDLTQQEIARQTGYSRSMVSRMLTEARAQRLVEIRVRHPVERRQDLEQALLRAYGLTAARVLERGVLGRAAMSQQLGILAARMLEDKIHNGMTIGVSWGHALLKVVRAVRDKPLQDIHVVQLVGLLGSEDPLIDGNELARSLARSFGGRYSILPAPLIVENAATRDALLRDPRIHRVLTAARGANLALVGIGTLELAHCTLVHDGYMTREQVRELAQAGAVGDVCGIFFDPKGNLVETRIVHRVVGIRPEALRRIPAKIGVAGGRAKVVPMLGAIRAGLVDMLVTDDAAASGLLKPVNASRSWRGRENIASI